MEPPLTTPNTVSQMVAEETHSSGAELQAVDVDQEQSPATTIPLGAGRFPGFRRPLLALWWLFQVLLGIGFLLPLMAGLAAVPGFSLLSLGFMLHAEAEVARTGKLRSGFPLLPVSTRVGTIGLMILLFLLPVIGMSSVAGSQAVIAQLSGLPVGGLSVFTVILQVLVFGHLLLAIANGGSFASFLSPLVVLLRLPGHVLLTVFRRRRWHQFVHPVGNLHRVIRRLKEGTFFSSIDFWVEKLLAVFRPWYHFRIAVKAAVGALCWLVIPTLLLGAASTVPAQNPGPRILLSLIGGILMVPVAAWLPLLQCHQATTGRFRAIFEVRKIRDMIDAVPVRWAVATVLMYGLAVPLYLSKIVLPPADAYWLFTPLFILVIYPTRILMGWVYGTAIRQGCPSRKLIRWPVKLAMIPLLLAYSGILFALPLISEAGPRAMFENHAFLLPVPSGQFEQN